MFTRNATSAILCPAPEVLKRLLQEELDPTQVESIEEHIGVCPGCQQVLDRLVGKLPNALALREGSGDEAPPDLPGYAPLGRIDAGGMGVVWRVRDLQFGRDLAVKVIASWGCTSSRLVKRFIAEAQICAQLAHPFIVPVHAMSRLPDGRPYYTMKLVEGQTLASLLAGGPAPAERRMEFVQIFDKVCQAAAFAHGRGVIHRDLKPENVMVGAPGEVQLMDWGLAKVLGEADLAVRSEDEPDSMIIDSELADNIRTRVGSVLGTTAYMAPEQAQGQIEEVDRQSDVFGLGGILCKILTGAPPYTGPNIETVRLRAVQADLGETWTRLDGCGADPELIALAQCCLAPRKADRPVDAGAVASQLAAYQTGVQERLRQAELERAAAQAAAVVERTAKRRTRALAAAVLALVLLAAGGGLWVQQQAAEREAERSRREGILCQEVAADMDQAVRFRQLGHFDAGRQLLEQAQQRLAGGGPDDLRARVEQCLADTALVQRLDEARQRASVWVERKYDDAGAREDYAAALTASGLGREGEDAGEVGARVRACAVRAELVAALDFWASITSDAERRAWLLAVARAADPDPSRDSLRQPELWRDREALTRLTQKSAATRLPQQLVSALARVLLGLGGDPVPLLRAAQVQHPDDFWLNFLLGDAFSRTKRWDQSVSFYRAALALRPRSLAVHNNLGNALRKCGQVEAAIGHFEEALRLNPKFAHAHNNLGLALFDRGQVEAAIGHFKEVLRFDPRNAGAHINLGRVAMDRGQTAAAIDHFEEALRLDRNNVNAHYNLGNALKAYGQVSEAIDHYEAALRLDPENAKAHYNLGNALTQTGRPEAAIVHYKEVLRFDPQKVEAHINLGNALKGYGQMSEAIGHYEAALRLDPKNAGAHHNLGNALGSRGQSEASIAHYQESLRIDPEYAPAHYNLGNAFREKGQTATAMAYYKETLRLDPTHAKAHCNLGQMLIFQGRFEEALIHLQQGHEIGSNQPDWRYPSVRWVQEAQRLLLLDRKLQAILRGEAQPADAAERLDLAKVCRMKKEYAAATRFAADAFATRPRLAQDLKASHRYNSACAAALAGSGKGQDAASLSDTEKAPLRAQAREWLDADLALWSKQFAQDRRTAEQVLRLWLKDSDLAGVRDPAALAKLPEQERKEWQNLWRQHQRLLESVSMVKDR